jgi:hypothetical protein
MLSPVEAFIGFFSRIDFGNSKESRLTHGEHGMALDSLGVRLSTMELLELLQFLELAQRLELLQVVQRLSQRPW